MFVPRVSVGLLPNRPVPVPKEGALVVVVPKPAGLLPNRFCKNKKPDHTINLIIGGGGLLKYSTRSHSLLSLSFLTSHLCTHIPKASVGLSKEPSPRAKAAGRAGVGWVSEQTSSLRGSRGPKQTLITESNRTVHRLSTTNISYESASFAPCPYHAAGIGLAHGVGATK